MTNNEKKTKAKNRVEKLLFEYADETFFKKHLITLSITVQIYCTLKQVFKDTTRTLEDNEDFQKEFSKFYGIQRFIGVDFDKTYYSIMAQLRDKTEYDERELCEKLKDGDKIQFSFITKMLNMINDAKYPIYDQNIARAFGINPSSFNNQNKIDNYLSCYQIIKNTYNELLLQPRCKSILASFRSAIKIEEDKISDMRVLDIIIWKIGGEIKKNNRTLT